MKRTSSIVDELRRQAAALRSAPARDLGPAVGAALARDRRVRRRRTVSLAACAALVTVAGVLSPWRGRLDPASTAPVRPPSRLAAAEWAPSWTLERTLELGGAWLCGLQAPLERELIGLTEDARRVAGAVARRLPDPLSTQWDG